MDRLLGSFATLLFLPALLCAQTLPASPPAFPHPVPSTEDLQKKADAGDNAACLELATRYQTGLGAKLDVAKARALLEKAAANGSDRAMDRLGDMHRDGRYGAERDQVAAAAWYKKEADAKGPWGYLSLGLAYEKGEGVKKDLEVAKTLYARAKVAALQLAEAGDVDAMFALAEIYESGVGEKADPAQAIKWFTAAADAGDGFAMFALGKREQNKVGNAGKPDYAAAVAWYKRGAEKGSGRCLNTLGFMLAKGIGMPADPAQAVFWYRAAADVGDPSAMINLANCYGEGRGIKRDPAVAASWIHRAADSGFGPAMAILAENYATGNLVKKDVEQAAVWYLAAAKRGQIGAAIALAKLSAEQIGRMEFAEALTWSTKAAENGDSSQMNLLGHLYHSGTGVTRDAKTSFEWCRKSAEAGLPMGMFNYGLCFTEGTVVPRDDGLALEWMTKAHEAGCTIAANRIATMYQLGLGVPQSDVECVRWIKKGIAMGDIGAMEQMAAHFEAGTAGQPRDSEMAEYWYRKAAAAGGKTAKTWMQAHFPDEQ